MDNKMDGLKASKVAQADAFLKQLAVDIKEAIAQHGQVDLEALASLIYVPHDLLIQLKQMLGDHAVNAVSGKGESVKSTPYNQDFLLWAEEQAQLLQEQKFDQLDLENLVDEVQSIARREEREMDDLLVELLALFIKWCWLLDDRGGSDAWKCEIRMVRNKILERFEDSPTLKTRIEQEDAQYWDMTWTGARLQAERETRIIFDHFPEEMPWRFDQIIQEDWLPERF